MVVRATKPIKAGEQITHTYLDPLVDMRTMKILWIHGFFCGCPLCTAELHDSEDKRKRREIATAAQHRVAQLSWSGRLPFSVEMKALEQSLAKLRASYNKQLYGDVPRTDPVSHNCQFSRAPANTAPVQVCKPVLGYMISAYLTKRDHDRLLWTSSEFLLAVGYEDVCLNEEPVVVRAGKYILPLACVDIFKVVSVVMLRRGKPAVAAALEEQAKTFYLIANGVMTGYRSAVEAFGGSL